MRVDEEGLENFDDYLSESGTCSTYDMSLVVRKPVFGVSTRSDTNRAAKSQKMARGLKFCI